jgi:hypothetical protein
MFNAKKSMFSAFCSMFNMLMPVQLNSFSHLRALSVLHDRSNTIDVINNGAHAGN